MKKCKTKCTCAKDVTSYINIIIIAVGVLYLFGDNISSFISGFLSFIKLASIIPFLELTKDMNIFVTVACGFLVAWAVFCLIFSTINFIHKVIYGKDS